MSDNGNRPAYPYGKPAGPMMQDGDPEYPAEDVPGLTKREAFAMAAMQGLLANPYYAQQMNDGECSGSLESAALYHADALLAELAKDPTP